MRTRKSTRRAARWMLAGDLENFYPLSLVSFVSASYPGICGPVGTPLSAREPY
ncbi:uncharacterized protein TRIVIDRAFT_185961 [Trichoderma virens Gv29-8]|uniref:Uncharacterized protein n=1 Tax=Hypocrea virens (strain Gv29-8 / FGSC 10586) TaxID=413071 RepID=G9MM12_HYPVG|nr:uncharacterized protein TRIVIDRAFT_185961 [Trichoderma virens Gv29-8]EHK24383.1 hypothetical protein TRIVIDRAFT_185961 [Trichoderma virens Gv29-8]